MYFKPPLSQQNGILSQQNGILSQVFLRKIIAKIVKNGQKWPFKPANLAYKPAFLKGVAYRCGLIFQRFQDF